MENNRNEQGNFSYTYSAREQAELKKIREKYTPSTKEEDKLARLRRLDAGLAVRNTERGVTDFAGLFTEDGAQQALLGSELGLTLGSDLTHQNVTGTNLGTHTDNAPFIQVLQRILTNARNIAGNLLRSQLGVTSLCLVFLNVYGSVYIFLYQSFT